MASEAIEAHGEFVRALYQFMLLRPPSERELLGWSDVASRIPAAELVKKFGRSQEYLAKHRVRPYFPNGHYHSPVVDPSTIKDYVAKRERGDVADLKGISIDIAAMNELWERMRTLIPLAPFPTSKRQELRFYFDGSPFPFGDALSLFCILAIGKPKRIIEIGSGYSTACMLDTADFHGLSDLKIFCIEPYPDRLKRLIRPEDMSRVTILESQVQAIPSIRVFEELEPNDILFIDSTHVLKTGSDVHFELFDLLPALKPGVIVHVHDCPYPFEYPRQWLEENYSWNEAYAIRAFLMYNQAFRIIWWASLFRRVFPNRVRLEGGSMAINPGTSLWLCRN